MMCIGGKMRLSIQVEYTKEWNRSLLCNRFLLYAAIFQHVNSTTCFNIKSVVYISIFSDINT